jgi:hypothetical protein
VEKDFLNLSTSAPMLLPTSHPQGIFTSRRRAPIHFVIWLTLQPKDLANRLNYQSSFPPQEAWGPKTLHLGGTGMRGYDFPAII